MTPRERVRAWVDGELSPEQEAALLAEAQRDPTLGQLVDEARAIDEHVRALRAQEPAPSEDLGERALRAAVRARREEEQTGGWAAVVRAVTRPRWLRLRVTPAATIGLAAAGALVAWLGLRAMEGPSPATSGVGASAEQRHAVAPGDAPPPAAATADRDDRADSSADPDGEVPVRFVLPAEQAEQVSVAGDFNDWNPQDMTLEDPDGDGVFSRTVWLRPGSYAYMFVVDGERWVTDPYASNYRDDGFGNRNAVLRLD